MGDRFDVVEHVLQTLKHGGRSSTYKHAVLIGLLDLCLEQSNAQGWPPSSITTRQLAEKVIELYWPQVRPWGDLSLRQNAGPRTFILRRITELRNAASSHGGVGAGPARVRLTMPEDYEKLVRGVEWKLIEMPLPKLQRVGKQDTGWFYTIGWDDGANMPKKGDVSRYQAGLSSDFDNRILLHAEVAMAFVRLHGLLRPFVEQEWAKDVATLNRLDEGRLHDFLFGAQRTSLERVRTPLYDLQSGSCFYCGGGMAANGSQVDHFIPWARHADNGLHNLVLAHGQCNRDKSDFLAGVAHIARWRERNETRASHLAQLASELTWEIGSDRTLGAARALYWQLPATARLWVSARSFEIAEAGHLRRALV